MKKENKIEVNVLDYNNQPLEDVRIEIISKGKSKLLAQNKRTRAFEMEHENREEEYEVVVSAPGMEPQRRTIKSKDKLSSELFILGKPNMPSFYRGNVKVPFEEINNKFGVVIETIQKENPEFLSNLKEKYNIQSVESDANYARNNLFLFKYPVGLSKAAKDELMHEIQNEQGVNIAQSILKMNEKNAMLLTDEMIVRFKESVTEETIDEITTEFGLETLRKISYINNCYQFKLGPSQFTDLLAICADLVNRGLVEFAEPNVFSTNENDAITPTNYLYPEQWDHPILRMPDAWQVLHDTLSDAEQFGSPDILVAVVDSGIDVNHPHFNRNVSNGLPKVFTTFDFTTMNANNTALQGTHGTCCASASTGFTNVSSGGGGAPDGTVGIAGNCRVIGVIYPSGPEIEYADMYIWLAGFNPNSTKLGFPNPLARGVDVITNSYGAFTGVPASGLMSNTFDFLTTYGRGGKGTVIAFSVGNYAAGNINFHLQRPWAAHRKTIACGATSLANDGLTEIIAAYSGSGTMLDVCAPSHDAYVGNGALHNPPANYAAFTGTCLPSTRATTLNNYVAASLNMTVANAAMCSNGDYIIIEVIGSANAEVRIATNVNTGTNVITLNAAFTNPHMPGVVVAFSDGNMPRNSEVQTTMNAAIIGAPSITVASPAGFINGNALLIGNPSPNVSSSEGKTIMQVNVNSLRIDQPLFAPKGNLAVVNYGRRDYRNDFGGTSYATPVIAGVAALILSVNKHLTWIEVREILRGTAIKINPANATPLGWVDVNGVAFGNAGYLTPFFSQLFGYGRVDAAAAVTAAKNFNHDQRDLIIRKYMDDDGKSAVDLSEHTIDSPDIWMRDGAALVGPFMHGVVNTTPANINTSGSTLHLKPKRSVANINVFARIYNRGTGDLTNPLPGDGDPVVPPVPPQPLNYSYDYGVNIFLALKDIDINEPISTKDFIDGPTTDNITTYIPFSNTDPLSGVSTSFNLNNNLGNGVHPGSRSIGNFFSVPPNFLQIIPANKARIYVANLAQADRPRLPYSFVMVRTTKVINAVDSIINLENTRGLVNGQQILIGRPTDANYRVATINANPTSNTIVIQGTAGTVYPVGTFIIRLDNVSTTMSSATPQAVAGAKFSILNVNAVDGFKVGNYVMSGAVVDATNNKFHRIVRIKRNTSPLFSQLVIEPPLGAGGLADATLITQVGGRLKTFILAEVNPHDGKLAGNKPEDNNNISYKEITFGHEILFKDNTGNLNLSNRIQVANSGTSLSINFRIYIKDGDAFTTEDSVITVTRKLKNGNFEAATFYYKITGVAAWEFNPASPTWLTINSPKITLSNADANASQTDIYFEGSFKADKNIEEIEITVNAVGNDTHPLGAQSFISTETFVAKIFAVADLPDLGDPNLQNQTGMPALTGTQMLHAFAEMTSVEQTEALCYGAKSNTLFRLTSSFNTNANPAAIVNAYAVLDGIVFIQRNISNNTMNLILKPLKQAEIGFNRVKYFIYRGIKEEDFFTAALPNNLIVNSPLNPNAHFVDSVIFTQSVLNPGQPVLLTALGWDPTNQASEDLLDDFFFNSSPLRQLPVVKRGMTLGKFKNAEFGFEIVLSEGAYPITLDSIRKNSFVIDVSTITNNDDKRAKREDILNYIDPAAYYGMHYLSGIMYPILPDPDASAINCERKDKVALYDTIIAKFFTKNTLYIDIRNENGYSYNYYNNYTQLNGSDLGKAIKIGFIPPAQQALSTSLYGHQEWPIMLQNNTNTPESNPENMSAVYMQLSTADNGNPIAFFEYGNALTKTTENNYVENADLLEIFDIVAINPALNLITVNGSMNNLAIGDLFYVISCAHAETNTVYKLISKTANLANATHTDLIVEINTLVHTAVAGASLGKIHHNRWTKVIAISHPNHPAIAANQKLNIAHVLKLRYFRQTHETGKRIIAIDQANKRFTIISLVARLLAPGDKIIITNATTNNNGTYTIAPNGVAQVGSNTEITIVPSENIPSALSVAAGAHNGLVKIKPSRVPAVAHYSDHKFGSLNAIIRQFKITNINVVNASSSVITIAGDYRHIVSRNTRLSIINATTVANNGTYVINGTPLLSGGNTQITITTSSAISNAITAANPAKDLISVLALPWRSDHPTQWISGFDFRYLDARKQLTTSGDIVKDGFAYMGQTGVAIEQNRIIFQMTPLSFFKVPTEAYTSNIINMNGGTTSEQSFWKVMQSQNQGLILNATMLRINPGPVIIPVFDFIDDTTDAIANDPMKNNFLSLCITQIEFHRLKEIAETQLNSLHDLYIVLRREKRASDTNAVNYRTFELAVTGYTRNADNNLVAHEAYPTTPVVVYCLREDAVIFTSKDFADLENTSTVKVSYEETLRMNNTALNVYALNPTIQAHINTFNTDLIALNHDFTAIQTLVQNRAEALWNLAVSASNTGGLKPYDDRQLYWARLHARNAIREHATLLFQFARRKTLMQLFEERSRGFHTVNFAAAPAGAKKILVLGFDLFGLDPANSGNPLQSNPSGALALHLHGKTITKGPKSAFIQGMIFPVRYGDFDAGLVERILHPFITGANAVDMIISTSMDFVNYFNIDRFASKFRNPIHRDNENNVGSLAQFYSFTADGKQRRTGTYALPQFIETNLPAGAMDDTIPNDRPDGSNTQIVVFNQKWNGKQADGTAVQNTLNWDPDNPAYNPVGAEAVPAINIRAVSGSGGDYLVNEIFYRIALMRTQATISTLRTGHLNVPLIQADGADFSQANTQTLVDNAKTIITDALTAL